MENITAAQLRGEKNEDLENPRGGEIENTLGDPLFHKHGNHDVRKTSLETAFQVLLESNSRPKPCARHRMKLDKAEIEIDAGLLKREAEFETLGTGTANSSPATMLHRYELLLGTSIGSALRQK